jgi:SAM-dependent methyltransferase
MDERPVRLCDYVRLHGTTREESSWSGVDSMGDGATWQRRVEEFVLDRIGGAPARVLEVGCGEGALARALARAGHSVTAIDPQAPEEAPERASEGTPGEVDFRRAGIEGFSDPGPFDCVVAVLSLHHIEDLAGALDKVAGLLRADGNLVVVEFAWERIDGATAAWVLARLPVASPCGHTSWLERCCGGRGHGGGGGRHEHANHADHAATHFSGWAEEGFHDSRTMRSELGRRFVERHFEWVPYLYPDLAEGVSEADETAAIEAGTINATGFRYVGVGRASIEP